MKVTPRTALQFLGGTLVALILQAAVETRWGVIPAVLGALVLVVIPCTLLIHLSVLREARRNATVERRLISEATRRLADLEELHHANRLVTLEKLASMAHELGTPLAIVQARAQMIAAGEATSESLLEDAAVIVQQTRRMTQMVSDVLDLAKRKTTSKIPVDLAALARQTVSLLEPLADKDHVKLKLAADQPGTTAQGDASQLLQILINLTMNAKQAMPRGGTVTLTVGRRLAASPGSAVGGAEADYLFVDVRDEGAGIATRDLPRIFDTFFTTKKEGEGSGLGLSVSYRIASEHGGWIDVDSRPGEGSCFTLYLPWLVAA